MRVGAEGGVTSGGKPHRNPENRVRAGGIGWEAQPFAGKWAVFGGFQVSQSIWSTI
jgi:hypothetical protein